MHLPQVSTPDNLILAMVGIEFKRTKHNFLLPSPESQDMRKIFIVASLRIHISDLYPNCPRLYH